MRALTRGEIAALVALVVAVFLCGMSYGNFRAEQNLYLMFMKLGSAATEGDPAAIKACDGLKEKRSALDATSTSRHIYQVLSHYDRREDRARQ
jgi:hypothetical protein